MFSALDILDKGLMCTCVYVYVPDGRGKGKERQGLRLAHFWTDWKIRAYFIRMSRVETLLLVSKCKYAFVAAIAHVPTEKDVVLSCSYLLFPLSFFF